MLSSLRKFEAIARRAHRFTEAGSRDSRDEHPFVDRNIHADLPIDVRKLFDNGHYAQATFEAFKFVDEEIQRITGESKFGTRLMESVFGGEQPRLQLNPGMTLTEKTEQRGFERLFSGAMMAIRNPRGHTSGMADGPDTCLDHLAFASLLLRRLDEVDLR